MSKYNYFDDLPLIYPGDEPQSAENVKVGAHKASARSASLTPRGISADSARAAVKKIMQSEVIDEVKEIGSLPNLRTRLLKLTAFLLALIAVAVFIFAFSRTISSQNDKINKFYADAGKVCTDYIKSYGTVKWEPMDEEIYGEGMTRLTGLCYARQMDFDRDGSDELMLCYNNRNVFTLEVWGYKGKDFIKLYGDEANKTADPKDGSRISFFYKNNKYYIYKSEPDSPENIKMYALKGDSFKESGECLYDWKNNIYTIDGVINAQDFETINLSVIKSSKAEQIVNIVLDNIDSFHTVSVPAINTQKTDAELKADAYYAVIETRNDKYGEASVENKGGSKYLDGLCYASLIDFDNDENDELVLVYRKMVKESATNAYNGEFIIIENPAYCIEVYGWNGTAAKKDIQQRFRFELP